MITTKLQWLLGRNTIAITIWPFIIIKKKYSKDQIVIDHEKLHLKQQVELFIIPFYIWYIIELLIKTVKYKNINDAYFNLGFEREAYFNETTPDYLKKRKTFTYKFLKYV